MASAGARAYMGDQGGEAPPEAEAFHTTAVAIFG
jgi:hypothetical protein